MPGLHPSVPPGQSAAERLRHSSQGRPVRIHRRDLKAITIWRTNDNMTPSDGLKMFRSPAIFTVFQRGWTLSSHLRQEHLVDDMNNAIVGWYVRFHNMSHIDLDAVTPIDVDPLSLDCRSRQPLTRDRARWYITG
jgi:hypothetical protein